MALDTATACRFVGFTRSWINEDLESNRPLLPKLELDLGKASYTTQAGHTHRLCPVFKFIGFLLPRRLHKIQISVQWGSGQISFKIQIT